MTQNTTAAADPLLPPYNDTKPRRHAKAKTLQKNGQIFLRLRQLRLHQI
jgi:hypothetical protein